MAENSRYNIGVYDWQADTSVNPSAVLDEISALWLESPAFDDGNGKKYFECHRAAIISNFCQA